MPKLKADRGYVIRSYMIDIDPFCRDAVRRVLIDEHGMVFVPSFGWSSIQDSYHLITLPGQTELPNAGGGSIYEGVDFGDWWERSAWDNDLWAWCHMGRGKLPDFHACHSIDNGDGTRSIFAA